MRETLETINTERFIFDPKRKDFISKIEQIPEFKDYQEKDRVKVFTWIVLMWDINSPIKRMFSDYYLQKNQSALIAGFRMRNSKFISKDEEILLGKDPLVNNLISVYLAQFHPEYTQLMLFLALQADISKKIMEGYDKDYPKNLELIGKKMVELTHKIYGSGEYDESQEARKALYAKAEKDRISRYISPEGVTYQLDKEGELPKDFDQWNGYKPEDITFLGDE